MVFIMPKCTSVEILGALSCRDPWMRPFCGHLDWKPREVIYDIIFYKTFQHEWS
jgi:hypothetical protein